jgi:two-component system phosphate regulon sensor histidine kinase PhoR
VTVRLKFLLLIGTAVAAGVAVVWLSFAPAAADRRAEFLPAALLLFAVLLVSNFLYAKWIAGPLKAIAVAAGKIAAGDREVRIGAPAPVEEAPADELVAAVTSLDRMVERLRADIANLKKLERVRREFLGNVSHELRTPIFAIQGMLETLEQGAIDDREVNRDFVVRALRNTRNLNTLLTDLIEISRIESGDMKMSYRYFALGQLVDQVAADMKPAAEQKGITLRIETGSGLRDVYGDKERLKQVLMNLVNNGVKYNAPGGSVVISLRDSAAGVEVAVADTGIGIPAEHLPRIFERFYRVDRERSREAGGTGLGLAIVKHIVEAHGSIVRVESAPGEGTTFRFTLKTAQPG